MSAGREYLYERRLLRAVSSPAKIALKNQRIFCQLYRYEYVLMWSCTLLYEIAAKTFPFKSLLNVIFGISWP